MIATTKISCKYLLLACSLFPTVGCQAQSTQTLTRAPYLQNTTTNSAYLIWNTARPLSTVLEFRRTDEKSWHSRRDSKTANRHNVQLNGLRADTNYLYRVGSNGNWFSQGTFQTDKSAGQRFRVAIWGDSGEASSGQKRLAKSIEAAKPDLLLHTGDLIYPRGAAGDYDPKFFSIYAPTLARVPFYGSMGNHDVITQNGRPWLDAFVLPRNGPPEIAPERNYSFDYADAHIAILDSNARAQVLAGPISRWLTRDMNASDKMWKFVVFHHPPISEGLHGNEARTRALMPLFSRLKIDIVFNGHDHVYSRSKVQNGVIYVVTGAGGAGLYARKNPNDQTNTFANARYSFTQMDIEGRFLRVRQIADNGQIIDDWRLSK